MAKEKKVQQITDMEVDFAQWYTDICRKAELVEYASVKGFTILRPYGYAIWENIQSIMDAEFKKTGHENVAMPVLIPESLLKKEGELVNGFAPEVAWVTMGGYNLLPYLTPLENVLAAMEITSNPIKNKKERARELLTRMGITEDQMNRNINKLSGGEQQRVAIARAISTNAEVILADEPTGNLDVDTAAGIVKIFKELAHEDKKCVIAVTHSEAFAAEADVVVRLEKKKLQD